MARSHKQAPSFSQLNRLAEYEEWRDWKKEGPRPFGRQGKSRFLPRYEHGGVVPLDRLITGDGVKLPEER